MKKRIDTSQEFEQEIAKNKGVLFYFATTSCDVGEALEPKVRSLLSRKYPKIEFRLIDMNVASELAASLQVFVEPTILLFVEEKETIRKSRHIGISELDLLLGRIYDLAFTE